MKIIYIKIIYILLIFLYPSISLSSSFSKEFLDEQTKSIVKIQIKNRTNKVLTSENGLIINENGYIITNCSVIKKWYEKVENILEVELNDKTQLHIEDIVSKRCENNLAIIKVKERDLISLKVVNDPKVKKGDIVLLLEPYNLSFSEAKIENINNKKYFLKHSSNNSGLKPVFNKKGEVIATIIISKQKSYTNRIALSLENIIDTIRKKEKTYQAKKLIEPKSNNSLLKTNYIKPNIYSPEITLAIESYKTGDYEHAIKNLLKTIQSRPSPDIYLKVGSMYLLKNETTKALEAYQKAVELAPKKPEAHFNLGIAYYLNNNKREAFKEYKILSELNKELAEQLKELIE